MNQQMLKSMLRITGRLAAAVGILGAAGLIGKVGMEIGNNAYKDFKSVALQEKNKILLQIEEQKERRQDEEI